MALIIHVVLPADYTMAQKIASIHLYLFFPEKTKLKNYFHMILYTFVFKKVPNLCT